MERFVALDSWRGLAACMVALYHFDIYYPYSRLHGVPLVQHAYLFVDFFFVLSGFVIAANYQQRLLNGSGVWRFLLLRLARVYPMHVSMLALYVVLKLLMSVPFEHPHEALDTILANLLLVHSLHLYDFLTWNLPSWSISTEFYTYVIFAACLLGLRRHGWIALLVAILAGPALIAALGSGNMQTTYDWGIIRCLYGFAAGVIVWNLYQRWKGPLRRWLSGTIAEWCTILLMVAFVSVSGGTLLSVAAPYVFALAVLVFAFEAGTTSTILKIPQLSFLGLISYSFYMTHVFIAERLFTGRWGLFPNLWHTQPFAGPPGNEGEVDVLAAPLWHGDIAYLSHLAITIVVSAFTYTWIEKPARDWVRNRAGGRQEGVPSAVEN